MGKIFSLDHRDGFGIANIGWHSSIEEALNTKGLIPFAYISSYKNSADDLVEMVLDTQLKDMYVFPIVFMYRQYLELLLKNAYFKLSPDKSMEKIDFIQQKSHKLSPFWYKIKSILRNNDYPIHAVKYIEGVVKEFEKYDSHSFNFRFFANKDSTPTLPETLSVDLAALKDAINEVDTLLYGTYG